MPFFLLSIVESGVCALDERHANSISLYRDFMIESLASASLAAWKNASAMTYTRLN